MKHRKPTRPIARSIALCAFSLVVTCSTTVATAGKPATSDFIIETNQDGGNYGEHWYDYGRFKASGAVHDNGSAFTFYDGQLPVMELYGKRGDMDVTLWSDANGDQFFTIIAATGKHSALVGITGTVSRSFEVEPNGDLIIYQTLMGSIPP